MRHGRMRFAVGFLTLPVLLYVVYVISPYAQAFQISMTNWRGVDARPEFVGLENFQRLLDDPIFWKAISHNAILLICLPVITLVLALLFAYLLNAGGDRPGRGIRGSGFYRVVFFFPQVLSVTIIAVMFQSVLRPDRSGVINGLLMQVGLEPVGFLTNPALALWSILGVLVWQAVGFYVVLFSAGMAAIPKELNEAAQIDGAGKATTFFHVTLPLLRHTVQVGWVYLGVAAFDAFSIVFVLSAEHGGPDYSTTVLANEVYRNAFGYAKFGYASAIGVALFFCTLTFAALTLRLTRRDRLEY
ncbi:carbohydrate ABC transporter permease [Nonomuraea sp. NPDC050536]|uniref:carbohydrate ABC transporter permease n=1 Tax=Nonomuraea sp. NPDC050536 TaxID=3364366 RepID=UPI0037C9679F